MPSKADIAAKEIVKEDIALKIYNLVIQGLTTAQIAKQLDLSTNYVSGIIKEQRQKLSAEMLQLREAWTDATMGRTEWMLSKVFPVIEKQANELPSGPDPKLIKLGLDIMAFQQKVVAPEGGQRDTSDNRVLIQQTFVAHDGLYDDAVQQIQTKATGYTVHEVDTPQPMKADARLVRLEELATEFLPEGFNFDDDDADNPSKRPK